MGSKGIPGNYGGYETFVDRLTEYHQSVPPAEVSRGLQGQGLQDLRIPQRRLLQREGT
ncbi:DUF1972 domain-containing protein [Bifidobacterium dentium]|uniref:DUF1972 domain-containing protein n=1 Tax=Bifidobacterium dentium TaxID=1689 RepID=UPI0030C76168